MLDSIKRSFYAVLNFRHTANLTCLSGVLILIVFLAVIQSYLIKNEGYGDSEMELKLVHVIFRHGARTPHYSYPQDPFKDEKYEPYGLAALTNEGKTQMFELGKFLRTRYRGFLPAQLNFNDIHAQTTDLARNKMSLQLVLAGLYPPKGTQLDWNPALNWQPIPYSYEKLMEDTLLLVTKPCPRYHEELERVFEEDLKDELNKYSEMFRELSIRTGWKNVSFFHVSHLYGTLRSQKEFGLKIPDWADKYYSNEMREAFQKGFIFDAYNSQLKKLKGGYFVRKAIEDWENKIEEKISEKILLFSAQDRSVATILSAFNCWDQQNPEYGITAMLEFHQHKFTKKFGVKIFLRNSTLSDPHQLEIEGCNDFCHLEDLKRVLKENIPGDYKDECKALNPSFTTGGFPF